jgi:hypothetical protein
VILLGILVKTPLKLADSFVTHTRPFLEAWPPTVNRTILLPIRKIQLQICYSTLVNTPRFSVLENIPLLLSPPSLSSRSTAQFQLPVHFALEIASPFVLNPIPALRQLFSLKTPSQQCPITHPTPPTQSIMPTLPRSHIKTLVVTSSVSAPI